MQAFLNLLRTQPAQKADQSSIPFSENTSSSSNQEPTEPVVSSPPSHFDGVRKIHPNQVELLSSKHEIANQPPNPGQGSANERGMRVPSALERVANRKVTPTGIDETIRESSELQRSDEMDQRPPHPESSPSRKQNLSLFSAVPFSGATGWSTFGRNQKEKQNLAPLTEDRLAKTQGVSGATVSRTSSQSRTTTTVTRTPPTRTSGLSRSSSAKLSRNDSTKHPPSSAIEHASYSRVPLAPTHDIHENTSPRIAEGEASPSSCSPHQDIPSTPDTRPLSVFNSASGHEHIDGTYPPRTSVTKKESSPVSSSLPFTFGRQPPARPLAENLFISEFGSIGLSEDVPHHTNSRRSSAEFASRAAAPGGNQWPSRVAEEMVRLTFSPHGVDPPQPVEPFPLLGTPTSDLPPSGHTHPRNHLASDSSTDPYGSTSDDNTTGGRHAVPSLVSDHSNAEPSSSQGTGRGWTMDLPLRGMASFGSSGDELTNPRVASSWTNPSDGSSRFEPGTRIRQMSSERRRRRTGSSSSTGFRVLSRRISSEKAIGSSKEKNQSLPAVGLVEPIVVFPVATTSSQEFPKQADPAPVATTSTHQASSEPASDPPTTSNLQVTPAVEVTAPTPRPSPGRSSNRLTDLFTRDARKIPDGHAHASGIGVVGVEPHSRRQSLKVMGKRKAGETEEDEIIVHDERGYRPRFDSSAPSSYHRKRMKLSNASTSEKDAAALRASRAASRSGAASTNSFDSSRPATAAAGARRSMSRNASAVSIPISAIVSPRAPSIRRSISRRSDGFRYEDPLRNRSNRNQRRRKRETFADSWILDREEMPIQAWLFLAGFLLPLCWWAALVIPVRKGGRGKDPESGRDASADKSGSGLWVDQTQYDEELSRMWRTRCLVAAIISTLAYVPIIVCAVIFSKR